MVHRVHIVGCYYCFLQIILPAVLDIENENEERRRSRKKKKGLPMFSSLQLSSHGHIFSFLLEFPR